MKKIAARELQYNIKMLQDIRKNMKSQDPGQEHQSHNLKNNEQK